MRYIVFAFFCFMFSGTAFSQENITITTYYPAPIGVYENLRFFPTTTVPACDANNEGIAYYDNNANLLMVCRQTGTSPDTYAFSSAGSLWTQVGSTGPNGADPRAIRPFDTNLKVGIGDVNIGWNRQNRFAVTDNTTTNSLGEQIALVEILNPRRGNSGAWSGNGDSVTALQLTPGQASWQVRADEFNSVVPANSAAAGAFMIHQTVNGNPQTRFVIRNNGNVGIGTNNPGAMLDVSGEVRVGSSGLGCNDAAAGAMRYNGGTMQYCDGRTNNWANVGGALECVHVHKIAGNNPSNLNQMEVVYSSNGAAYAVNDIVEYARSTRRHYNGNPGEDLFVYGMRCKNGWVTTGCGVYHEGDDTYDEDNPFFQGICGDIGFNSQYIKRGYTISCCRVQ